MVFKKNKLGLSWAKLSPSLDNYARCANQIKIDCLRCKNYPYSHIRHLKTRIQSYYTLESSRKRDQNLAVIDTRIQSYLLALYNLVILDTRNYTYYILESSHSRHYNLVLFDTQIKSYKTLESSRNIHQNLVLFFNTLESSHIRHYILVILDNRNY